MLNLSFVLFFLAQSLLSTQSDPVLTEITSDNPAFDSLVWADEFSGNGAIDAGKWFLQTQLPPGGQWWGGLVQHYTDRKENTYQQDGFLNIVAKRETFKDQGRKKEFTAARLNSKFAFTYGRVEIRAKLPTGLGTWPAIWMLNKNINEKGAYWEKQGFGTTSWPHCGEIDIVEHWGKKSGFYSERGAQWVKLRRPGKKPRRAKRGQCVR